MREIPVIIKAMASASMSTENFLCEIDPDLVQYSSLLVSKGFTNTKVLAHLTYQDIYELPIGHRRLLINEVSKIRSPHSKALLSSIDAQELQIIQGQSDHLQPRELFPSTPTTSTGPACPGVDPRIDDYHYSTPMDKHLNRVMNDIETKDVEITKLRCEIDSVSDRMDDDDLDSRPCCSLCHERGHKKNRCTGAKCLTSVSCGRMRLHKDEMKAIDGNKATLKKLVKEKTILEAECEKIQESIRTNNRSFPQAVRSHLINSNKPKYLTMYGDAVVPLTKIINLDLSILQKYYDNRVPQNLHEESRLFEQIICTHNSKFKSSKTSINAKLMESVRKIESRIHRSDVLPNIGTPNSGRHATNYASASASATPVNSVTSNAQQFATPTTTTSIYAPQIATSAHVMHKSAHNQTHRSISSSRPQSTRPSSTCTFNETSMNTPRYDSLQFRSHSVGNISEANKSGPEYEWPSLTSTGGKPPFDRQFTLTENCPQPHSNLGTPEYIQLADLETMTTKFGQLKSPERKRVKVSGLFPSQEQLCHSSVPKWHNPNIAVSETGACCPPTNNPPMFSSITHAKMVPDTDPHPSGRICPQTASKTQTTITLGSMQAQLQLKTESVGSYNPENNKSSHYTDYSPHLFDQFNVKPKTMLVRRFESSEDGQNPILKSPDLD